MLSTPCVLATQQLFVVVPQESLDNTFAITSKPEACASSRSCRSSEEANKEECICSGPE